MNKKISGRFIYLLAIGKMDISKNNLSNGKPDLYEAGS
jgi:hypothetical protein